MKRSLTNLLTFICLGFLLIGIIGVVQNVVIDVHKTFTQKKAETTHLLAYSR